MKSQDDVTQDVKGPDAVAPVPTLVSQEVRPRRRSFTQAEKIAILEDLDGKARGSKGTYLRQKGQYSSVVYGWRREFQVGSGLQPKKRGPKPDRPMGAAAEIANLRKQLARAEEMNRRMQIIIDVQKKVSQMLGVTLPPEAQ